MTTFKSVCQSYLWFYQSSQSSLWLPQFRWFGRLDWSPLHEYCSVCKHRNIIFVIFVIFFILLWKNHGKIRLQIKIIQTWIQYCTTIQKHHNITVWPTQYSTKQKFLLLDSSVCCQEVKQTCSWLGNVSGILHHVWAWYGGEVIVVHQDHNAWWVPGKKGCGRRRAKWKRCIIHYHASHMKELQFTSSIFLTWQKLYWHPHLISWLFW